jgi:hypothetical protein
MTCRLLFGDPPFVSHTTQLPFCTRPDGERCGATLQSIFENALHPEKVIVGVVEQNDPEDAMCVEEYCKKYGTFVVVVSRYFMSMGGRSLLSGLLGRLSFAYVPRLPSCLVFVLLDSSHTPFFYHPYRRRRGQATTDSPRCDQDSDPGRRGFPPLSAPRPNPSLGRSKCPGQGTLLCSLANPQGTR